MENLDSAVTFDDAVISEMVQKKKKVRWIKQWQPAAEWLGFSQIEDISREAVAVSSLGFWRFWEHLRDA